MFIPFLVSQNESLLAIFAVAPPASIAVTHHENECSMLITPFEKMFKDEVVAAEVLEKITDSVVPIVSVVFCVIVPHRSIAEPFTVVPLPSIALSGVKALSKTKLPEPSCPIAKFVPVGLE